MKRDHPENKRNNFEKPQGKKQEQRPDKGNLVSISIGQEEERKIIEIQSMSRTSISPEKPKKKINKKPLISKPPK